MFGKVACRFGPTPLDVRSSERTARRTGGNGNIAKGGSEMGADLVASILEMRKDREPDWEAAERYLMDRGDDDLERIRADRLGDEEGPDGELGEDDDGAFENGGDDGAGVSETKARFLRALEAVASCWIGDCRSAIKHQGAETVILIVGGTTYGEPLEEIADAELFVASGMARAAGFIVGDAS